jgi:hypothetical protein
LPKWLFGASKCFLCLFRRVLKFMLQGIFLKVEFVIC